MKPQQGLEVRSGSGQRVTALSPVQIFFPINLI